MISTSVDVVQYIRNYDENMENKKIEYTQKWLKGLNEVKKRSTLHRCRDIRRYMENKE